MGYHAVEIAVPELHRPSLEIAELEMMSVGRQRRKDYMYLWCVSGRLLQAYSPTTGIPLAAATQIGLKA